MVENLFTTNAAGGDISGMLSDDLTEQQKLDIASILPTGATGVTVEGVDRSMNQSSALVTATLSAGGEQSYRVTLVRSGIGWKVSDVTVEYPALDGGQATIATGDAPADATATPEAATPEAAAPEQTTAPAEVTPAPAGETGEQPAVEGEAATAE